MNYEELVTESIKFFENAKKRSLERFELSERPSTKLQLKKEIEMFTHLMGFRNQEATRIEMNKKYSKNSDNS